MDKRDRLTKCPECGGPIREDWFTNEAVRKLLRCICVKCGWTKE